MSIRFDVYDQELNYLITLDSASDKQVRVRLNEAGYGKFTINRHAPEAYDGYIKRGNSVRVTIDPISEDPIAEFFILEGDFDLLSKDGEGGEDLHFGGPGTLDILRNARIDYRNWVGTDAYLQASRGRWHFTNQYCGAILARMMAEAIARGILLGTTRTFSTGVDTNGVPWSPQLNDWDVPIGANLYDEAMRLIQSGLITVEMVPGMVMNAYMPPYGRDLNGGFEAGTVRFEKGINIVTELNRSEPGKRYASNAIIRKVDGRYTDAEVDPGDFPVEAYYEIPTTHEEVAVQAGEKRLEAGQAVQQSLIFQHLSPRETGIADPEVGIYLPGPLGSNGHFWLGDQVSIFTGDGEWDYDEVLPVTGITFMEDEAGELDHPIIELSTSRPQPSETAVSLPPPAPTENYGSIGLTIQPPTLTVNIGPDQLALLWGGPNLEFDATTGTAIGHYDAANGRGWIRCNTDTGCVVEVSDPDDSQSINVVVAQDAQHEFATGG